MYVRHFGSGREYGNLRLPFDNGPCFSVCSCSYPTHPSGERGGVFNGCQGIKCSREGGLLDSPEVVLSTVSAASSFDVLSGVAVAVAMCMAFDAASGVILDKGRINVEEGVTSMSGVVTPFGVGNNTVGRCHVTFDSP